MNVVARIRFKGLKKSEEKSRSHGLKIDFPADKYLRKDLTLVITNWIKGNMSSIENTEVEVAVYREVIKEVGIFKIQSFEKLESYIFDGDLS